MVDGTVDNQIPGEYKLAYSFYDNGKKIERDIFIRVVDTEAPVITMTGYIWPDIMEIKKNWQT